VTDLLDGIPPKPGNPQAPPPSSVDEALARALESMKPKPAPAPAAEPRAAPKAKEGERPWWTGRTFYSCPICSAQDERTHEHKDHPDTVDCWQKDCPGQMAQWVPPTVQRERLRLGITHG
jgi:hypothetical protein